MTQLPPPRQSRRAKSIAAGSSSLRRSCWPWPRRCCAAACLPPSPAAFCPLASALGRAAACPTDGNRPPTSRDRRSIPQAKTREGSPDRDFRRPGAAPTPRSGRSASPAGRTPRCSCCSCSPRNGRVMTPCRPWTPAGQAAASSLPPIQARLEAYPPLLQLQQQRSALTKRRAALTQHYEALGLALDALQQASDTLQARFARRCGSWRNVSGPADQHTTPAIRAGPAAAGPPARAW